MDSDKQNHKPAEVFQTGSDRAQQTEILKICKNSPGLQESRGYRHWKIKPKS